MRILVLTNNSEENALYNYWIFKRTFILSGKICLKKFCVIFQLETALQQNSGCSHLILIDVQYLQKAVLAFKKVWMVKITPSRVPTTRETPQQNFWFPPPLEAIWKTLKVEVIGMQKITHRTWKCTSAN